MKKIILALSILILLSCEDDRLPENTFDSRKATSERELLANGLSVIPGQVVSVQLEYKNQDLSSVSSTFDTGGLGDDIINLTITEPYEYNYRLDNNGLDISVRLLNEGNGVVFELNQNNKEFKGLIDKGNYKIVIQNNIEWEIFDSSLVPVFIQPDPQYLGSFGDEVFNNFFLERDLFQLISVQKCEYCDLKNAQDSSIFGNQIYNNVSFRGSDLRNSDFSNSQFKNAQFSSFIDNTTVLFTYGQTNLNNSKFTYCIMDSVNFSDTYDLNKVHFYYSDMNFANFRNTKGQYIDFESTLLWSSSFTNVKYDKSRFVGSVATSSDFSNSSIINSNMTSGVFTNSNFNYTILTANLLNYARFDSVSAKGADFCLITAIGCDFDSLKVDSETKCNPNEVIEEEEK
jgi:uncharacterized protein YjbI with pentapeptide repeats